MTTQPAGAVARHAAPSPSHQSSASSLSGAGSASTAGSPPPPTAATAPTTATAPTAATGAAGEVGTQPRAGVPARTLVLFILGCVLLVVAAANLTNLGVWSQRWGTIPVFLIFFLVMSIAGRWFWAGADAIWAAIRGGKQ